MLRIASVLCVVILFCGDGSDLCAQERPSVASIAAALLNDQGDAKTRNELIAVNVDRAGPLLAEMARGLGTDPAEEYRRIPWIWRVAVAAGKKNDRVILKSVLEVSLPQVEEPLRDWQAVVLGGGVINGVSLAGAWPGPRIQEILAGDDALARRWTRALEKAGALADDQQVTRGTRYDALRMIPLLGWEASGPKLRNYLTSTTHPELQMGAVSGCGDLDDRRAAEALIDALPGLHRDNVKYAVAALHRNSERKHLLEEAVAAGRVPAELARQK